MLQHTCPTDSHSLNSCPDEPLWSGFGFEKGKRFWQWQKNKSKMCLKIRPPYKVFCANLVV
mgnify:CR=1 FL=1